MSEALPIMLKALRLPAFGQHYQDYQTQATENAWGYSHYLAQLCEQEVAWRFQTRVRNWTKEAKLPRGKSFATLTINELPKAIQPTIIALRCLSTKMSDQSFKQPLVRMTVQRAILSVGSAKPRKRVPSSVYCQTNVPGYVFSLPHRRPSVQPAAMYQGLHDVGLA